MADVTNNGLTPNPGRSLSAAVRATESAAARASAGTNGTTNTQGVDLFGGQAPTEGVKPLTDTERKALYDFNPSIKGYVDNHNGEVYMSNGKLYYIGLVKRDRYLSQDPKLDAQYTEDNKHQYCCVEIDFSEKSNTPGSGKYNFDVPRDVSMQLKQTFRTQEQERLTQEHALTETGHPEPGVLTSSKHAGEFTFSSGSDGALVMDWTGGNWNGGEKIYPSQAYSKADWSLSNQTPEESTVVAPRTEETSPEGGTIVAKTLNESAPKEIVEIAPVGVTDLSIEEKSSIRGSIDTIKGSLTEGFENTFETRDKVQSELSKVISDVELITQRDTVSLELKEQLSTVLVDLNEASSRSFELGSSEQGEQAAKDIASILEKASNGIDSLGKKEVAEITELSVEQKSTFAEHKETLETVRGFAERSNSTPFSVEQRLAQIQSVTESVSAIAAQDGITPELKAKLDNINEHLSNASEKLPDLQAREKRIGQIEEVATELNKAIEGIDSLIADQEISQPPVETEKPTESIFPILKSVGKALAEGFFSAIAKDPLHEPPITESTTPKEGVVVESEGNSSAAASSRNSSAAAAAAAASSGNSSAAAAAAAASSGNSSAAAAAAAASSGNSSAAAAAAASSSGSIESNTTLPSSEEVLLPQLEPNISPLPRQTPPALNGIPSELPTPQTIITTPEVILPQRPNNENLPSLPPIVASTLPRTERTTPPPSTNPTLTPEDNQSSTSTSAAASASSSDGAASASAAAAAAAEGNGTSIAAAATAVATAQTKLEAEAKLMFRAKLDIEAQASQRDITTVKLVTEEYAKAQVSLASAEVELTHATAHFEHTVETEKVAYERLETRIKEKTEAEAQLVTVQTEEKVAEEKLTIIETQQEEAKVALENAKAEVKVAEEKVTIATENEVAARVEHRVAIKERESAEARLERSKINLQREEASLKKTQAGKTWANQQSGWTQQKGLHSRFCPTMMGSFDQTVAWSAAVDTDAKASRDAAKLEFEAAQVEVQRTKEKEEELKVTLAERKAELVTVEATTKTTSAEVARLEAEYTSSSTTVIEAYKSLAETRSSATIAQLRLEQSTELHQIAESYYREAVTEREVAEVNVTKTRASFEAAEVVYETYQRVEAEVKQERITEGSIRATGEVEFDFEGAIRRTQSAAIALGAAIGLGIASEKPTPIAQTQTTVPPPPESINSDRTFKGDTPRSELPEPAPGYYWSEFEGGWVQVKIEA